MISVTLDKSYGEARVLRGAKLDVIDGSVHALVGENGAGKSTLVKILAGIVPADGGSLSAGDRSIDLARWDRRTARAAGIGIVQQHGAFAGTLSVVENAVLGAEGGPLLELAPTAKALAALGERVGLPIDPWARCDALSLGAAQRAEIVAALHAGAKWLVLDEPTAVLAPVEVDGLLATLRALARAGTTIVLVTHKLDEVRAVADAVTVLRAGQTVATFGKDASSAEIARAMVGAELPAPGRVEAPGESAARALELAGVGVTRALFDVSLTVRAGELVGVAGVDGNGQRELARAIAGLEPCTGRIAIAGRDVSTSSVRDRLAAGLAHVPEDRHHGGLVLDATIADNLSLGRADVTGRFAIDRAAVARFADARIAELDIRPPEPGAIARTLSGGNQQKIVIGRELSRPKLAAVVASQPTRGVDLGAVLRIHDQLRAAAKAGAGVLVISADLDELLALCHRIVVLLRGRIVGEAAAATGVRDTLGALMTGATA
ncbi:MAG TPA: ATP-binding cassette domain-containing protein [Kofleriaceae bacterium]|jgi:simple sugar transport system ATP-binding protein